jgi:hypothetical protein
MRDCVVGLVYLSAGGCSQAGLRSELLGKWVLESMSPIDNWFSGLLASASKGATMEITREKLVLPNGEIPYRIVSKTGKADKAGSMDLVIDGESVEALFDIEGKRLRICFPKRSGGNQRPSGFDSKDATLFVLRRP